MPISRSVYDAAALRLHAGEFVTPVAALAFHNGLSPKGMAAARMLTIFTEDGHSLWMSCLKHGMGQTEQHNFYLTVLAFAGAMADTGDLE